MDVCRTCLGSESLSPIFLCEDLNRKCNELFDVTGIKIESNDGLPQLICQPCISLVNGALKLRQQSALSEATLLESGYRKFSNNDKKEVSIESINYSSDSEINSPLNIDNTIETEDKLDLKPNIIKDNNVNCNPDNKRRYYCRNTPINRMVTVKEDTYKVKVEIGNVVWESEIKKDKKLSYKDMTKKTYNKGLIKKKSKTEKIGKKLRHVQFNEDDVKIENIDSDIESSKKIDENEIGLFDHLLLGKRRTMTKEKLESYTALAVTPYDKKGPVKCKLCHKVLMNFRNFLNHCKIHFAAENTCETCGKEFVNRNSMRYHQMRLHGVEKMHKCQYCDYKGVDVYQMKNHERRVHTGEKPFVCNECGVSFYLRAGIAQHMRKHFAVKSIQCDRCPAMFRSRNELTTHKNKVHLMHYTYYCYLCPEKYRAVGTVRKHLVRRHGVLRDQQLPIPVSKTRKTNEVSEAPPQMWPNEVHREGISSY